MLADKEMCVWSRRKGSGKRDGVCLCVCVKERERERKGKQSSLLHKTQVTAPTSQRRFVARQYRNKQTNKTSDATTASAHLLK